MEKRNGKVIFAKAGGNVSKNARTCKVSIPKSGVMQWKSQLMNVMSHCSLMAKR